MSKEKNQKSGLLISDEVRQTNRNIGSERGVNEMKRQSKKDRKAPWAGTALVLALVIVLCAILPGCGTAEKQEAGSASASSVSEKPFEFTLWNEGAPALKALKEYVQDVTDETSEHFIPKEDRIAAFDMDGTLYGELAPIYVEWWMYEYRVNEDSSFSPDEAEKAVADQIAEAAKTGTIPENIEEDHAVQAARAFAGMTVEGYRQYVREFVKKDVVGFENLTYKDAFFLPMKEIIEYLNENDFSVYVCSGTDRFLCRELGDGVLPIAENHFIGMDVMLKARGQGDKDGLEYVYTSDDEVVRTDELLLKTVKMNKVSILARELGQPPVLCFGNSSGDVSMAEYTVSNNPYYSKAFMVVADDDVREYGNPEKAAEKKSDWESHGWETISMKDDWKTIYGENVKRTSK